APAVYDPVREYHLGPAVAAKVRHTGYLGRRGRPDAAEAEAAEAVAALAPPGRRLVLCLVGGGQDGVPLAEAFASADLPPGALGVILTGPFMPPETRRRLRRRTAAPPAPPGLEVVTHPDRLLAGADGVIAMGGYNTISELLAFGKRALIVPRTRPRREQLIRAERLRDLGLLELLHPDALSPRALGEWLAPRPGPPPPAPGPAPPHRPPPAGAGADRPERPRPPAPPAAGAARPSPWRRPGPAPAGGYRACRRLTPRASATC